LMAKDAVVLGKDGEAEDVGELDDHAVRSDFS
jgi:hypothetical protein